MSIHVAEKIKFALKIFYLQTGDRICPGWSKLSTVSGQTLPRHQHLPTYLFFVMNAKEPMSASGMLVKNVCVYIYIYIYIYIYNVSDLDIEWISTYLFKNWGNSEICQNRLSQIKASFIYITWYSVKIDVSITIISSSSGIKIMRFRSTCGHNISAIV